MDAATVNALISGSAALLGAATGGFFTYVSGARQHKRQIQKERQINRRDREREAALECEALCIQMADDMEHARRPSKRPDDTDTERGERVKAAYRKFTPAALYLPKDVRQRIETVGAIIRNAGDLSYGSPLHCFCHYDQPYTICWHARRDVRAVVAAFVKDEPIPEPDSRIVEYQAALDDLNKDRAENYSYYDDTPEEQARRSCSACVVWSRRVELILGWSRAGCRCARWPVL